MSADLKRVETFYFNPKISKFTKEPDETHLPCTVIIDPNVEDPTTLLTKHVQFLFSKGFFPPPSYQPPIITNNVTTYGSPNSITSSLKQLSWTLLAGAVMGACIVKFGFRLVSGVIPNALKIITDLGTSYFTPNVPPENPQETDPFNNTTHNLFHYLKKHLWPIVAKVNCLGLLIGSLSIIDPLIKLFGY